jgi:2-polyprenyl-3-methyl-5-hydroxy-6-metoxy-1,4-benzoquinol methylase
VGDPADPVYPALQESLAFFGDLNGRTLLDLGCGAGSYSLFFTEMGARVIAVDLSARAIENLKRHCAREEIENVTPICTSAMDLGSLPPVDFVFGSMILHHIEPFDQFAAILRHVIRAGGRGFLSENSARSDLLIWFRTNVVGRFGVPKFGDNEEFPLSPSEIRQLRTHFDVKVVHPELYFFRMISTYLLRGRLEKAFLALDRHAYKLPRLRPLSYRQYLYLS